MVKIREGNSLLLLLLFFENRRKIREELLIVQDPWCNLFNLEREHGKVVRKKVNC